MQSLETKRLILRGFREDDLCAVQQYAACFDNVIYMPWGPNSDDDTRAFIRMAMENTGANFQFAAVVKENGRLIGACNLVLNGDQGEIGWIVHRDFWKMGFATEMGAAMLKLGFDDMNLRRIVAFCDAENTGSYRVMEKLGMRREGLFFDARPANKVTSRDFSDELSYAILRDEYEIQKEIAFYNGLPCEFRSFSDIPPLSGGDIYLVCEAKKPAIPEKKFVPAYVFSVCKGGEKIGEVNLRIGYSGALYYSGQIGYNIDEAHRGNGYAGLACQLIAPIARFHGMEKLLITNNHTNIPSRRVCEKLGAKLLRIARLPEWHDIYKEGQRFISIYEWSIGSEANFL